MTIPPAELFFEKNPFRAPSGFNLVEAVDLSAVPAGHCGVKGSFVDLLSAPCASSVWGFKKTFMKQWKQLKQWLFFFFLFWDEG